MLDVFRKKSAPMTGAACVTKLRTNTFQKRPETFHSWPENPP
jgi:hypothetical protein